MNDPTEYQPEAGECLAIIEQDGVLRNCGRATYDGAAYCPSHGDGTEVAA